MSPRLALSTLLPLAGFVAFAVFVVDAPIIFLVAAVVIILVNLRQASLLLRVDASGVLLGRGLSNEGGLRSATVPWSSLESLRVVRSASGAEELELRLNSDAPLPEGARAIIRAPGERSVSAPELRVALPDGSLDRGAFERAVAAFGGGVPVHDASG